MSNRTPMIAGNWKMNLNGAEAAALAAGVTEKMSAIEGLSADVVLCPPTLYLRSVVGRTAGTPIAVGAQNCHAAQKGAHTGDVSAAMIADCGASHVIVGHSERRADHGESSADVRAKADAALAAGLTAIVCVGETRAEKDIRATEAVVRAQIAVSLPRRAAPENTVIAYEPVWAIGTGRTPTPEDVDHVHKAIRAQLMSQLGEQQGAGLRILYGGSVKPGNATELMAVADVDGALVGGASLTVADFCAIIDAAL